MLISKYLDELNIDYELKNEDEISSLGLAGYNDGDKVATFIESSKYIDELSDSVVLVITNKETINEINDELGAIIVDKPRETYFRLHNLLCNYEEYVGVNNKTTIGEGCSISPLAVIADNNVIIGNNVVIEEFVVIRENTIIGDNTIIRAGCKIGGEGFEFKNVGDEVFPVKHVGKVCIGRDVEIQYNTCIDKAIYPWDKTEIGNYVKIDNLVHIGHAVKVKERTMIVANSGIGGRTNIGKDAWIGFGATLRNGIDVGDNSRANIGAVVTKNILENESVTGNFAIEHKKFIETLKKK